MRAFVIIGTLLLSGCGLPPIDVCKGSAVRRSVYTSTIRAVDLAQASGRVLPREAILGREAAQIALSVLDRNCPVSPS